MNKIINEKNNNKTFEDIKHIDNNGNEYWFARELQLVLEYTEWRNFDKVIKKAIISAENSSDKEKDWVVEVNKPIKSGKGKDEFIKDYKLSRYICYLIVQNADPNKKIIALGQTYFAIQTRKQEITEQEFDILDETEKRLYNRSVTKKGNFYLNQIAKKSGVKNFDKFHNEGYKGLYNGETANDIAKRKGLRYREDILDNMGSDELAANIFRISQTKQNLESIKSKTENEAFKVHNKIGKIVRNAIKQAGGKMPEDLPTPKKSLKQIGKENKSKLKKQQ